MGQYRSGQAGFLHDRYNGATRMCQVEGLDQMDLPVSFDCSFYSFQHIVTSPS
jgi:hypothetical protein